MQDPVLKLQYKQEVVLEGWLQKRTQGKVQTEPLTKPNQLAANVPLAKTPKPASKLNLVLRSRYFVLLRTSKHFNPYTKTDKPEDAYIVYYMRKPKIEKFSYDPNDPVETGDAFVNINPTTSSADTELNRKKSSRNMLNDSMKSLAIDSSFESVNLETGKNVKKPTMSVANNGGARGLLIGLVENINKMQRSKIWKIQLSSGDQIFLEKGKILRLATYNPVKTIYLQPYVGKNDAANANIIAGQWLQAIREALAILLKAKIERDKRFRHSMTFFSPSMALAGHGNRNFLLQNSNDIGLKPSVPGEMALPQSFKEVLDDSILRKEFMGHLKLMQAEENLEFYDEVAKFKRTAKTNAKDDRDYETKRDAKKIVDQFVKEKAVTPINISSFCREEIENKQRDFEAKYKSVKDIPFDFDRDGSILSPDVFDNAEREVFLLMEANFFHSFYEDLCKRTGCFANVLYKYDLVGYNAVVSYHFGSVTTELDRLLSRYDARLEEIKAEVDQINLQLEKVPEPAVTEFESSASVISYLYGELSYRKLQMFAELENEIKLARDELANFIMGARDMLKMIIERDKPKLLQIRNLETDNELLGKFRKVITETDVDFRNHNITAEEVEQRLKPYGVNIGNLKDMIRKAEDSYQKGSQRYLKEKEYIKNELIKSLDSLEQLDLRRLTTQERVMKNVLAAEMRHMMSMTNELMAFQEKLKTVDIKQDIKSFTSKFLENNFHETFIE